MRLSIIAATSENNVIGKQNRLLWRIPADFERMKALTKGKPLIMGRKTHESIGRALPGRMNIIVTRDAARAYDGCVVAGSLEEGIRLAQDSGADEAFIFGGGEIYAQTMDRADRIYLTRIHADADGDSFFPAIDPALWRESERDARGGEGSKPAFTFLTYERV